MGALKVGMNHEEAAKYLRREIIETLRYETGRLVGPPGPAFFGAVRSILTDLDYVAALYSGALGRRNRRDIGQRGDTVAFLSDVMAAATGDAGYRKYGEHLRDMFRVGTVHLRAPKQLENAACSTPILSWAIMEDRTEHDFEYPLGSGKMHSGTHMQPFAVDANKTVLPVSITALFEDFIAACEHFAKLLEAEKAAGGHVSLDRWWSVADVLVTPEPAPKLRW